MIASLRGIDSKGKELTFGSWFGTTIVPQLRTQKWYLQIDISAVGFQSKKQFEHIDTDHQSPVASSLYWFLNREERHDFTRDNRVLNERGEERLTYEQIRIESFTGDLQTDIKSVVIRKEVKL